MSRFNLTYSRGGEIFKIEIKSLDGPLLDRFKGNLKEDFPKVVDIIKRKYGISFKPEIDEDLKWLKK